jgi:hypothetical protein
MLNPVITLVDMIFKTFASQRNIRYEARAGATYFGTPEFQIGIAGAPALVIADSVVGVNNNLFVVGNITLPTETSSRALIINGINEVESSATTSTELGYVSGVTSPLQTQIETLRLDAIAFALSL